VVAVAEQPVREPRDLLQQVERATLGQPLPVTVIRGPRELNLMISPEALPLPG
jgi:S1-C subfamily serine protease